MSIRHTHNLTVSTSEEGDAQGSISAKHTEVGTLEKRWDRSLSAGSTNILEAATIDVSEIQSYFFVADADVTLKTNSSGSPANTITLKAGVPIVFRKSNPGDASLFTTDVTAFYLTAVTAARFRGRVLLL